MKENGNNRYVIDSFHSKTLEGNPLGTTADRDILVYLPPGYFDNKKRRYPVIYFLHGYGGHNHNWTIASKDSEDSVDYWKILPKKYLKEIDVDRVLDFEKLDDLIAKGELAPFIFIQPDGSLHAPHKHGLRDFTRRIMLKGSFYINSPHTGNYRDYIINDVIDYIDNKYRTISDRQHRAIMGGSMGGYGTLYLAVHHPEKFISAVSLSPADFSGFGLTQVKLRIPIFTRLFGEKFSNQLGDSEMDDILDTMDLITSKNNPLLPSIKNDSEGNVVDYNKEALNNWLKHDINKLVRENPEAFKKVHLYLSCDLEDEFKLADGVKKLHETLNELDIPHMCDLDRDPKAALTPHMLGIGYRFLPGIKFCLQYFS